MSLEQYIEFLFQACSGVVLTFFFLFITSAAVFFLICASVRLFRRIPGLIDKLSRLRFEPRLGGGRSWTTGVQQ